MIYQLLHTIIVLNTTLSFPATSIMNAKARVPGARVVDGAIVVGTRQPSELLEALSIVELQTHKHKLYRISRSPLTRAIEFRLEVLAVACVRVANAIVLTNWLRAVDSFPAIVANTQSILIGTSMHAEGCRCFL